MIKGIGNDILEIKRFDELKHKEHFLSRCFTEAEIAEKLGTICRGLLISLNYPKDERTGFVPGKDKVIPGSMNEYRLKK